MFFVIKRQFLVTESRKEILRFSRFSLSNSNFQREFLGVGWQSRRFLSPLGELIGIKGKQVQVGISNSVINGTSWHDGGVGKVFFFFGNLFFLLFFLLFIFLFGFSAFERRSSRSRCLGRFFFHGQFHRLSGILGLFSTVGLLLRFSGGGGCRRSLGFFGNRCSFLSLGLRGSIFRCGHDNLFVATTGLAFGAFVNFAPFSGELGSCAS